MTGKDLWYKPKLIEVALPLEDINRESAREKPVQCYLPNLSMTRRLTSIGFPPTKRRRPNATACTTSSLA